MHPSHPIKKTEAVTVTKLNHVHLILQDRFAEEPSQADALAAILQERAVGGTPPPICFQRMVTITPPFLTRLGEQLHKRWPKTSATVVDSFQNLFESDRQLLLNTISLASR